VRLGEHLDDDDACTAKDRAGGIQRGARRTLLKYLTRSITIL
jgi:hypothetical protein